MVYANFESVLVPEDNGKQIPEEFYTNKHQKHVVYSYDYKQACVDDRFSKPFRSYLGENAIYNFINSIIKESKKSSDVMKKHFNKELVMTKENDKDFENSSKCCISHNFYVNGDVKIRDHCHFTGKYKCCLHRDCNISVKLNHKIPVVFHELKKL